MGLVWLWVACLLMCRVMFLFCWRFGVGHLALKLTRLWVELGLSVAMEALSSCLLMFPGVRSPLVDQNPGVESPTSGVQAWPLIGTPRPHKPHNIEDQTLRLLLKATFNSLAHPVRLTPKSSNISRKVSGPVVGSVWSAQSQMWPYFSLYLLLKFTVAPKVHSVPRLASRQWRPRLTEVHLFSQAEKWERHGSHNLDALGSACKIETWWILVQSEVGCTLSQRNWPQIMGP